MPELGLRKTKPQVPNTTETMALPQELLADTGVPKFAPGNILLSNREKQTLEVLGHEEGKPIPAGLAAAIAKAKKSVADDTARAMEEIAKKGQKLAVKTEDINALPAAKQKELRQKIAEAAKAGEDLKSQVDLYANVPDSVAAAMRTISTATTPAISATTSTAANEPAPAATTQTGAQPQKSITGLELTNCPHCNWLLSERDDVEPTHEDLLVFVAATGSESPFVKEYSLYGGRVQVVFRRPSVLMEELLRSQANHDRDARRFASVDDAWIAMTNYRALLSLCSLTVKGQTYKIADEIDELQLRCDANDPDQLRKTLENMLELPLFNDASLWRSLCRESHRFARLVNKLEVRADDENFWKEIEV